MKTEFRNRAFLPIVMPLAILGVIGTLVGAFALILLYVNREAAIALALAAAAGILIAAALASSKDKTDEVQKGAVGVAALTPIVVGVLLAVGLVGGIADEDLNINREPHGVQFVYAGIINDAPTLAAISPVSFCLPAGDACTDTKTWAFTYDEAEGVIRYAFDNRNAAVEHNLFLFGGEALDLATATEEFLPVGPLLEQPELLLTPGAPTTFAGPAAETYEWEINPDHEIPSQAYFVCTIHPTTMFGVVDIAAA